MNRSYVSKQAGVTLTELLVVLVIVSILATIAVPVYINKAENARKAVALYECRQIAEAEESCASIHGFYVPIQVLNDMPAGSVGTSYADIIDKESSIYLIDTSIPTNSLSGPYSAQKKQDFTIFSGNTNAFASSGDARVDRLVRDWQGPFLNPQRTNLPKSNDPNFIHLDFPLDPWGNPYFLYAPDPWGLIGSNAAAFDPNSGSATWRNDIGFSDGKVTQADRRNFNSYAVVSYGPDGQKNSAGSGVTAGSDDIVYFFGRALSETNYNFNTTPITPTPTVTP